MNGKMVEAGKADKGGTVKLVDTEEEKKQDPLELITVVLAQLQSEMSI